MNTARDIMHPGAECIGENDTLESAARMMRQLRVGALPICGNDDRLHGIITDRDIVVRCVAEGGDPRTMTAREMAQGTPIWVDVDADQDEVLRLMESNKIRRLPVMEEQRIVGMISEADLAVHLDEHRMHQFAESIYSAQPNS
ncbi:CBS domain-containing protein [Phytohabitans sp. ZYX-F-186]|uniref:CBS domain-containing protein n=1 Tax=Phytohabitans maris TaxID=3071409 RepID=A0ABU0ZJA3_9ACTN|nr:CBS domain-containing protein [Phytohabitans sp. ZYX-F-186]MDQ7907140.1 CBS domain-containing protein [Phytohabitans sp. ZYX-F-186]